MIEWIKDHFYNDKLSEEMKVFNILHLLCVVCVLFFCIIVNFFFDDKRAMYLSFGVCVLFFLTMIEGNRTGRIRNSLLFMSVVFNIIFMPSIFFLFDRFICVIPIYFLFGLIYTIMLLDIKTGAILVTIEAINYVVLLIYGYKHMHTSIEGIESAELYRRYCGTAVGTIAVGLFIGIAVRYRYVHYKRQAEISEKLDAEAFDAYVAKDMFLINMSHEIRTPMNAIVGNIDLLLEQDVNEQIVDSAYSILNSCNALLAITDEIMDLSKAESGEIGIYATRYDLSELLMEVINMMTVRLSESNIAFYVDINQNIPRHLIGDASKIRQIFVNLLNNSVKYTTEGKIVLRVDYQPVDGDSIELMADVEDTGVGISRSEIGTIFDRKIMDSSRVITENESTSIGLGICKKFIEEMGGDISVHSEYNVGSVFTFKIPQKYTSLDTLAYVADSDKYYCLVYDVDEEHDSNISKILSDLGVRCDVARHEQDFERMMSVNEYTHVFVANDRSEECESFLENRLISSNIISILDINDNTSIKKAKMVINRPVNIINMAVLLNNETNSYVRDVRKGNGFTCENATILVVDDNYTNLNVASAILQKYKPNILTALSGKDCLRILQNNNVDIVFLDYMMPEMNGIDTLEQIRMIPGSRFAALPVIALTANVISGAREMFLEAGFDDFMAKPISVEKMEKIIKKYLPKDMINYNDILG